jgi:hypothetical protein
MASYADKFYKQNYLKAHIERILHDHFLFRKLTDSQCNVLLDCMQRVEAKPGDIVVHQVFILLDSLLL